MKRIFLIKILILSFTNIHALYISEIMYDPQGSDSPHEWIEVYNETTSPINLTTYKFFEGNTNHSITSYLGGNIIQPNSYAVIADNAQQFMVDNPSYQGILFDSSFSLSNSGENLIMKDSSLNNLDSITYDTNLGGANDGSTLSKIDGSFVRSLSTPGSANVSSPLTTSSGGQSGSQLTNATSTDNQVTVPQMSPPSPDIVFYLPFQKTVVAGADSEFLVYALNRAGKQLDGVTYTWSFGDGGQGVGSSTLYRYVYPGRYMIKVEGKSSSVFGVGQMIAYVVKPDIEIKDFGNSKYGNYVEIFNPNSYDLDLSGWRLTIDGASFPFPKNTILLSKNSTKFQGLSMGFASTTFNSESVIKILFPNQEEVISFKKSLTNQLTFSSSTQVVTATPTNNLNKKLSKSTSNNIVKKKDGTDTGMVLGTSTQVITKENNKDKKIANWLRDLFK